MNFKTVPMLLLTSIVCSSSFAMADDVQPTTDVYTLGEIVVSSDGERNVESIATNREVTSADIERQHVKTLDEALELVPGVYVRVGAQGVPRVDIRGMRSRHVVLLLNGVPINSTYDGQFDPSMISVEKIAKIKVSYGNSSVLYGQGALGGVINIITKKGTEGLHGNVAIEMDENGDPNAEASLSGGTEKLDFFVSANGLDSDGFNLSSDFDSTNYEDGGTRDNSEKQRQSVFANLGYQATDDLRLGFAVGYNQGEYEVPASTLDKSKDNDNFAKSVKYERVEDYSGFYTNFNVGYQVNDILSLKSWAYYNDQESDERGYDDDNYDTISKKGSYDLTNKGEVAGATVQGTLDYDKYGSFTTSIHFENNEYESEGYTIDKNKDKVLEDNSDELSLYSIAGEYNVLLFDSLEVVAGYSYNWQDKDSGNDESAGNYLIGLSYDLSEDTRFRASYARKTRFASIKNLYDASAGNETLSPEDSDNYEIGVTQQLFWGVEADLAIFQNDVQNYITKDTNDIYQNHDEYQFRGVEVTFAKYFEHALVQVGYSYLDSQDKSANSTQDDLEYRPKHKLTLEGSYDFSFGLKASANVMYLADQYYYDNDGLNKTEVGDITLVGFKLEQMIYNDSVSAYCGIDNLFDEDYEESYGYPNQGRLFYAGLKAKF